MAWPPAELDRALEIAYEAACRSRPGSSGPESWAGPRQLVVVAPRGSPLFHQQGCPRAGSTHLARFWPLTRALRQSRQCCPLCWPLHRQPGRPHVGRRLAAGFSPAACPLMWEPGSSRPCLTLRLPRIPSPRGFLRAPTPSDYPAEWRVLCTIMAAVLAHRRLSRHHAGFLALPPNPDGRPPDWPTMLGAARRLLDLAATLGAWPPTMTLHGDDAIFHWVAPASLRRPGAPAPVLDRGDLIASAPSYPWLRW